MPGNFTQKGFISILVILVIILISVGTIYYFLGNKQHKKDIKISLQRPMPTSSESLPTQLSTKADLSEAEKDSECQDAVDLWKYLPDDLKKKTYKEGVNPAGGATYDIFPLAWSRDCQKKAFLIELVGRGGDAYALQDFKPRGVYIFSNETQQIKLAYSIPLEFTFDEEAYESDFWFTPDKYIFVITTKKTKKEFISKRYEYDVNLGKVQPHGE